MLQVIIAGVPTENGVDSVVVRIQNLRRANEYAAAGINVGSVEYGDNCDGGDCGHNGRRCNCQWCFDMFLQEPECLDQWHADETVSSQWKNPDLLFKNPDFLLNNVDFIMKTGELAGCRSRCMAQQRWKWRLPGGHSRRSGGDLVITTFCIHPFPQRLFF